MFRLVLVLVLVLGPFSGTGTVLGIRPRGIPSSINLVASTSVTSPWVRVMVRVGVRVSASVTVSGRDTIRIRIGVRVKARS